MSASGPPFSRSSSRGQAEGGMSENVGLLTDEKDRGYG
jgi:hypothetical protein